MNAEQKKRLQAKIEERKQQIALGIKLCCYCNKPVEKQDSVFIAKGKQNYHRDCWRRKKNATKREKWNLKHTY